MNQNFCGRRLKVFETIKLERKLKTAEDFLKALNDEGCRVGESCLQTMFRATEFQRRLDEGHLKKEYDEISLCRATTLDLTGKKSVLFSDIKIAIADMGGDLCPSWVGPLFRKKFPKQRVTEWMRVAMKPINNNIWLIANDISAPWINSYDGRVDYHSDGDNLWLFVLPKTHGNIS